MSSNFGFNNNMNTKILVFRTRGPFPEMFLTSLLNQTTFNNVVNNTNIELKLRSKEDEDLINRVERVKKNLFDPNVPIPLNNCDPFEDSQYERDVLSIFKLDSRNFYLPLSIELELTVKKGRISHFIEFITVPIEWINNYNERISDRDRQDLQNLVAEADVIMIAIDSVLLFEYEGLSALKENRVEAITKIIQENYNGSCEYKQKLITFIPLNCEKYYNEHMEHVNFPDKFYNTEDPMPDLMTKVKRVYAPLIKWCTDERNGNALNLDVAILPVMTLGNIQFSHFDISRSELPRYSDIYYTYYKQFTGTCDDDDFMLLPEYAPKFCEQPLLYALLHHFEKKEQFIEFKSRHTWCVLKRLLAFSRSVHNTKLAENIPLLRGKIATEKDDYFYEILQSSILKFDEDAK